jgi:hypothetical protein
VEQIFAAVIAFRAAWYCCSCINIIGVLVIVGHFLQNRVGGANFVTRKPAFSGPEGKGCILWNPMARSDGEYEGSVPRLREAGA